MHNVSRTNRYKLDKANSAHLKQSPVKTLMKKSLKPKIATTTFKRKVKIYMHAHIRPEYIQ